jgi:hypothetical protein
MNEWLWHHLGMVPAQRFYEWNLLMNCPDFEELSARGLLVRDMEAEKSDFLYTKYGQSLDLIRVDGAIFGMDTNGGDEDEPYVEVDPRELIQYYFNWEPWLQEVREKNGLDGESSWLHQRLVFLGDKIKAGRRFGFVLGFIVDRDTAMDLLLGLPARISPTYDALVVTTLLSPELPAQDIATLERMGVYVVPPMGRDTLEISAPRLPAKQITTAPFAQGALGRHDGQPPIYITGDRDKWNTNTVLVGELPVRLGDKLFTLLLRLAIQALCDGRGTITKAALRSGGFLKPGAEEQTIGHLRKAFSKSLRGLGVKDLIQSSGRGAIRLCAHPALLKYNRDKLLRHGNEKIRRLAEQLPP